MQRSFGKVTESFLGISEIGLLAGPYLSTYLSLSVLC